MALLGAIAHNLAVGALDHKRVPHERRLAALVLARVANAVREALGRHGDEALALAIDPGTQRNGGVAHATNVKTQHDGAAHRGGTERISVKRIAAVVICPHVKDTCLQAPGVGLIPTPRAGHVSDSASCYRE